MRLCGSESKAFERSRNTQATLPPFSRIMCQSFTAVRIASWVELNQIAYQTSCVPAGALEAGCVSIFPRYLNRVITVELVCSIS